MPNFCAVVGCSNKSSNSDGKSFYRLPKVNKRFEIALQELQKQRRLEWLKALKRDDINIHGDLEHLRICSDHFIGGMSNSFFFSKMKR